MLYYVDQNAVSSGNGSKESPFLTISEAAAIACAGDEILVAPGIYREEVVPANGGSDEAHRIVYRSQEKGKAVILGSESVKGWEKVEGTVWRAEFSPEYFASYNPYTTPIQGDWYFASNPLHTGEIYLGEKSLYEVMTLDEVKNPKVYGASWDPDFTVYCYYTCQENEKTVLYANFHEFDPNVEDVEINVRRRCFFPEKKGLNYITVSGFTMGRAATNWAPPTAFQDGLIGPNWAKGWIIEDCEIYDSKCSGISLGKYYQKNNNNKWSTFGWKDGTQTERDAICQAQKEGWSKETIGSHIIRNCHIHHCGQTGIVGHLGGVFSLIEGNHIHNINNKQDLAGAEIGGIKMHAAIDCIYRKNEIHHCTRGLWLDWQAQGTRVTQNLFYENTPPLGTVFGDDVLAVGEDIFVEVSHGPTLIDHNFLLSKASLRLPTQGCAIVHNMIAGSLTCIGKGTDNGGIEFPTPRYTPYHFPHETAVAGFMTILHGDMRFYNNLFIQQPIRPDLAKFAEEKSNGEIQYVCGTLPYDSYPTYEEYAKRFESIKPMDYHDRDRFYDHLPVYYGGNVYYNGAKPCSKELDAAFNTEEEIIFSIEKEDGETKVISNIFDLIQSMDCEMITSEKLGYAFEPEQKFEAPDGSEIICNIDYNGTRKTINCPGPIGR